MIQIFCLGSGSERTPLLQPFGEVLWFQCWTNRGVFPVKDDLRNVLGLLHCGLFAPVFTADSDHPICIHALKKKKKIRLLNPLMQQSKIALGEMDEWITF